MLKKKVEKKENESSQIFVVVGLVFIPIGGLIIAASKSVLEYDTHYTDCTARTFWFANVIDGRPTSAELSANRDLLGDGETCVSVYEKWAKCIDNRFDSTNSSLVR